MTIDQLGVKKLEGEIQSLRMKMILTGCTKGLTHPNTIKFSQMLDHQLNQYQKIVLNAK